MTKKYWLKIVVVLAAALLPAMCLADVSVVFDNGGTATTTTSSTLIFTGTLTNTSPTDTVNLNALASLTLNSISQSGTQLTISNGAADNVVADASTSLAYLPKTLGPNQQYKGALVKVTTGATSTTASYWGNYTLLGGTTTTSYTTLGAGNFYVQVINTSSPFTIPVSSSTPATSTPFVGLQMPSGLQFNQNGNSSGPAGLQMPGSSYASGPRIIELENSTTPYWVSENNIKIAMWTDAVFLSYNNKKEDIQSVGQPEFDSYQNAQFIRLMGNSRIYLITGRTKKFIPSSIWNPAGIDPSQIIDVNKTDFNSYATGKNVASADELTTPAQ